MNVGLPRPAAAAEPTVRRPDPVVHRQENVGRPVGVSPDGHHDRDGVAVTSRRHDFDVGGPTTLRQLSCVDRRSRGAHRTGREGSGKRTHQPSASRRGVRHWGLAPCALARRCVRDIGSSQSSRNHNTRSRAGKGRGVPPTSGGELPRATLCNHPRLAGERHKRPGRRPDRTLRWRSRPPNLDLVLPVLSRRLDEEGVSVGVHQGLCDRALAVIAAAIRALRRAPHRPRRLPHGAHGRGVGRHARCPDAAARPPAPCPPRSPCSCRRTTRSE